MRGVLLAMLLSFSASTAYAAAGLTLVTTTSTEHSGLMDVLLPAYRDRTGVEVRAIVAPTGKALRIADAGDADVLIAHDRHFEEVLLENGGTSLRKPLMYNEFILVGPASDPAGVGEASSIDIALQRIADTGAAFASRGDDSGTHRREAALWASAGVASGPDILQTGSGQGPTLNFASARGAYALTDRGTWLFFANKGALTVLFEGGEALRNEYGVSLVNPDRHPHIDEARARAFIDWLTGPDGQALIASHRINGEQAFFPGAAPASE